MEDHEDLRQHCLDRLHLVGRLEVEDLVLVELLGDHLHLGDLWVVHLVEHLEEGRLCNEEKKKRILTDCSRVRWK